MASGALGMKGTGIVEVGVATNCSGVGLLIMAPNRPPGFWEGVRGEQAICEVSHCSSLYGVNPVFWVL